MQQRNLAESQGSGGMPGIFLEVNHPVLDRLMELPVSIQNLASNTVTLQADRMGNGWRPETLKGKQVNLRLAQEDEQGPVAVPGVISWVRQSGNNKNLLLVGLELADSGVDMRQALKENIHHTPQDICVLWERWDDMATQERRTRITKRSLSMLATALLTGGLACQIVSLQYLRLPGFFLILLGTATAAWRVLKYWWPSEPEEEY